MKKNQDYNFDLRSEKVRSIVGQIPHSLILYGITIIGVVLLILLGITYLLPYKQIYSGTAIIHKIPSTQTDSLDVNILLRFENSQPTFSNELTIFLQSAHVVYSGKMLNLTSIRDTLGCQQAICRFKTIEIKSLEHQSVDFQIVFSSGNLLHKMLGK